MFVERPRMFELEFDFFSVLDMSRNTLITIAIRSHGGLRFD
jgi:hypothetical protein